MLEEVGMLGCKPIDTTMDSKIKLLSGQREHIFYLGSYCRLVVKLNYLIVTYLDISFIAGVVSQFLDSPCDSWDAMIRILFEY